MDFVLAFYAVMTGMMATVNPCGIAMLPAYVGYALARTGGRLSVREAVGMGLAMAAGCTGLFVAAGFALAMGLRTLTRWSPFLGLGVGGILVLLALSRLAGRPWPLPGIPLEVRAGERSSRWTWFSFGVAYGLASLGCTLPLFLALVGFSLARRSGGEALLLILLYGLGMGVVLVALSVALALVGRPLAQGLRRLAAAVETAGALLLLGAGLYLIYYWGRILL
ncbi:MAG: cytochrome c biogenesis protein CcdA [Thermoflexus sp.]|jgi:cytochrome c biogenesis protein CcdA|nr:cytochrome c biogenesis protein CcdA [Thermoflexus sp.]MDT7947898.1 cytochrome c biogenesis protein CcdA [Thermoflexus sp.]